MSNAGLALAQPQELRAKLASGEGALRLRGRFAGRPGCATRPSCSIDGVSYRAAGAQTKGTHISDSGADRPRGGMIATMQTPTSTPPPPLGLLPHDPGSAFTTARPIDHLRSCIATPGRWCLNLSRYPQIGDTIF